MARPDVLRRVLAPSPLRNLVLAVVSLVVVVVVLASVDPFRQGQLTTMAYYGIAVGGLTMLTGLNGQLSLGHGALMAIGAYTTALLLPAGGPGLPLVAVLLAAVVVTAGRGRARRGRRRSAARSLPRRRHAGPGGRGPRHRDVLQRRSGRGAGPGGRDA